MKLKPLGYSDVGDFKLVAIFKMLMTEVGAQLDKDGKLSYSATVTDGDSDGDSPF